MRSQARLTVRLMPMSQISLLYSLLLTEDLGFRLRKASMSHLIRVNVIPKLRVPANVNKLQQQEAGESPLSILKDTRNLYILFYLGRFYEFRILSYILI